MVTWLTLSQHGQKNGGRGRGKTSPIPGTHKGVECRCRREGWRGDANSSRHRGPPWQILQKPYRSCNINTTEYLPENRRWRGFTHLLYEATLTWTGSPNQEVLETTGHCPHEHRFGNTNRMAVSLVVCAPPGWDSGVLGPQSRRADRLLNTHTIMSTDARGTSGMNIHSLYKKKKSLEPGPAGTSSSS